MSKHIHVSLSVRGALNWEARLQRRWAGHFVNGEGRSLSRGEFLEFLMDHLEAGHAVIPLGRHCDDFDWKTGCRGHPKATPRSA